MLHVGNVSTYYGPIQALYDVSIEVGKNEIVSIIGANGAGKSTLMKSIMGVARPKRGVVKYKDKQINSWKTSRIVASGIVYVPEGRYIFPQLSVQDNLKMGAYCKNYAQGKLHQMYEEMYNMFPRLRERRKQKGGTLSGGEQQMLAIARGLMSEPELIMFDEPSLGLAPIIVDEVIATIKRIKEERNIPVILVEQNAFKALNISDRTYILENGAVTLTGKSCDLLRDERVKAAYLGG